MKPGYLKFIILGNSSTPAPSGLSPYLFHLYKSNVGIFGKD